MSDAELQELQDPSNWEDDGGGIRPGVKQSRAIVSVAFAREDFARVVEESQRRGLRTSEFIRKAALDSVAVPRISYQVVSVSGLSFNDYSTNRTLASGGKTTADPPPSVVTG